MSVPDPRAEAGRWLRFASEDLQAAEKFGPDPGPLRRHVCWLSQQAVEKSLKAVLVFLQVDFPKTHDLHALLYLFPGSWKVGLDKEDFSALSEWSVEARYPGDWPEATDDEAREALSQAKRVHRRLAADLSDQGVSY